jgi:DNA-binding NarL/FixJ family response regulator
MLRVLIADEWPIVRRGIQQILAEEFGPLQVTQSAPAAETPDFAAGPWDVAIVTFDLPGRDALQFLAKVKGSYPDQRVLAVVTRANLAHFAGVLKDSIEGWIAKESTPEEVVKAVRRVLAEAHHAASEVRRAGRVPAGGLSKRELEVLRLITAGETVKQIATFLRLSEKTISTYRSRILSKLNFHTTADLIRYGLENRLAD